MALGTGGRSRRRACTGAVAALILGTGLMTGCGGGGSGVAPTTTLGSQHPKTALGKAAYDATMRQLGHRLARAVQSLFPLVEARPGTEIAKTTVAKLQRTRAVVLDVTARVAAISPPTPVRKAHGRLLGGVKTLTAELDELIHVLQVGTSRPFGSYTQFTSLRTIARARNEIERKGFAIG
jgi:hypothetical protein